MSEAHIRRIFATLDTMQADNFVTFFTGDGQMRNGNDAPLVGRDTIRDALAQGMRSAFKRLHHEIIGLWIVGDVAIVESNVTYTRLDGTTITLPASSILYMDGDLVRDYRVYMDIAPAFVQR